MKFSISLDYQSAVSILLQALPTPTNPELSDDDFGDFIYAPYTEYVAKNGCTAEYLAFSLGARREMTSQNATSSANR